MDKKRKGSPKTAKLVNAEARITDEKEISIV